MKRLILLISALTCVFSVQSQSCDVFPLAQNITYNSVEITWASSNAQNYQYQYKLLGSGSWSSEFGTPANVGPAGNPDTILSISNLLSDTTYEFRIKPFYLSSDTCAGNFSWTEINFTTLEIPNCVEPSFDIPAFILPGNPTTFLNTSIDNSM